MWLVYLCFVYGLKSVWIPWVWPTFNQIFLMVYVGMWLRRSNVLTGADLIEGWQRETDGGWSAPLAAEPEEVPRGGQPWSEFSYDKAAHRIRMKTGSDPRLHVFETVLREQGIDLVGKKNTKIEEITVVDTLKAGAANP